MRPRDTARLLSKLKSDRFCSGFVEFDKKKAVKPSFFSEEAKKVGYFPPFSCKKELLVNNPPNLVVKRNY